MVYMYNLQCICVNTFVCQRMQLLLPNYFSPLKDYFTNCKAVVLNHNCNAASITQKKAIYLMFRLCKFIKQGQRTLHNPLCTSRSQSHPHPVFFFVFVIFLVGRIGNFALVPDTVTCVHIHHLDFICSFY